MEEQPPRDPKIDAMLQSATFRLIKLAGVQVGVWLLAFTMFAASDSWYQLNGWAIAGVLNVVTAATAGFVTVTLSHEWAHYLGAKLSGGRYTIPRTPGLFLYDWDFTNSSVRQFQAMSIAGTIGGAVGVWLLWLAIVPDNLGRAAAIAGGMASFAFGSVIEWPVLRRVRRGGDPLQELSTINTRVLSNAALASAAVFIVALFALPPG